MTHRFPYGACMVRSPNVGRSRWLIVDVLTVVTLLLASAIEIFYWDGPAEGFGGPPAVAAVLAALGITPVLARRRLPLIAAGGSGAAATLAGAPAAPPQPPLEAR